MKKVIRRPDYPIVKTRKGKLHGYQEDDVFHFYGIEYGTAERFQLPKPMKKHTGIKDAKSYGYVAPLMPENVSPENAFEMPHVYWPENEQCLYLNIWTKHLDEKAKRPVMVWLHGGGFATGSSIEIPAYNGHNLSDYGDVVVVNLNHRLNCLGFLDLSAFGEKYKYSGCVGMADIVLALKWVQENIAYFGGDPDNVTVAGQSGGGGKATILMQMPVADGLYHKIISESGALRNRPGMTLADEKKRWQTLGCKTVEMLGLNQDTIDAIDTVDYETLARAAMAAGEALHMPPGMMLFEPSPVEGLFDGLYSTVGFRKETKDIPVLAGTVLGEFSFMHPFGDKTQYNEVDKYGILEQTYKNSTMGIVKQFRNVYPKLDILYALSVDTLFRPCTLDFLDKRCSFADAPCYNYVFSSIAPLMGGIAPWHCTEIPFVFRNVDMEPANCTREHADALQDSVSEAWLAFMKTGSPSTEKLPWTAYQPQNHARMIFDETCGMDDSDDSKLLRMTGEYQH